MHTPLTPEPRPPSFAAAFPELAVIADSEVQTALAASSVVSLEPGTQVFHVGAPCDAYLLVISGDVRVQVLTETGRLAVLYHVRGGDSCVLTTSCLLGGSPYPAEGVVDVPTSALVMPKANFEAATNGSEAMRRFVFANLGMRFADVIGRMEEIAFGRIELRLVRALLQLQHDGAVNLTHERLATETGTVREVVSRHLKHYEQHGWVRLGRGHIEVLDRDALLRWVDPTQ